LEPGELRIKRRDRLGDRRQGPSVGRYHVRRCLQLRAQALAPVAGLGLATAGAATPELL